MIHHTPEVAVVILNWNGQKFLEKFLPSVIASTYIKKRVIVADNASTDDSVQFLRNNFPAVELIINDSNKGFAGGYNEALRNVKSDYYVLLNSDVEVDRAWIEPVVELMESDSSIAACQPKLLSYHQKDMFEYAGACGGWLDNLGYPFARGRIFEHCEKDNGQYDNIRQCFWASGAALFIKAEKYHEVGGLDEYFFAHQEEIDLCWRLQLSGYKIFVQPASVVYHVGGGTLPKGNSRKNFLNFRNNLIMLCKNLRWYVALWKIPFRMALDGLAAWKELFTGDTSFFFTVIRAHFHFGKWLLFEKKKSIFPKSRKGTVSGWYRGSVVWDYFIRRKKTFFEIVGNK